MKYPLPNVTPPPGSAFADDGGNAPGPPDSPLRHPLTYRRQGGIAGLNDEVRIRPDLTVTVFGRGGGVRAGRLSEGQARELEALLSVCMQRRPLARRLRDRLPPLLDWLTARPDALSCRMTYGLAELRRSAAPEAFDRLVRWLEGVVAALPAMQCSRCGYDLTGNVSGTCPECGAAVAAAKAVGL